MPLMTAHPASWRPLPWLLAALLLLPGCKREPAELPGATAEPAATVRGLAERLRANDLAGFAKAAVTPEQYVQLDVAWREGHSRWPLTSLPLGEDLPGLLQYLSAPGAEQRLQRAFDTQIAGQGAGVGAGGAPRWACSACSTCATRATTARSSAPTTCSWSTPCRAGREPRPGRPPACASRHPAPGRRRAPDRLLRPGRHAGRRHGGKPAPARAVRAGAQGRTRHLWPGPGHQPGPDPGRPGQPGRRPGTRPPAIPLATEQIDTSATLVRINRHWYLQGIQDEVKRVLQAPPPAASVAVPADQAPAQPPKP